MTAAHVVLEIRNIQAPPARHATSALPEFLPPPRAIDLSPQKVRAIAVEGDRVEVLIVESAIIDERGDIAAVTVVLQDDAPVPFFSSAFQIDDAIPSKEALVCVLSYGDLAAENVADRGSCRSFQISRRPVLRVGTVVEHHPGGHRLCRGPCIETTIPVYSGMSGGPVFSFGGPGHAMRPIGLVCSDPDIDGPDKDDRTKSGSSIMAIIPCDVKLDAFGTRGVRIQFSGAEVAGDPCQSRFANDDGLPA
jgi:hypothetical protein